jgi:hypothetical protein
MRGREQKSLFGVTREILAERLGRSDDAEPLRFTNAFDLELKRAIVLLEDCYARLQRSKSPRVGLDGAPLPEPKPRPDETVRSDRSYDDRYRRGVENVFHCERGDRECGRLRQAALHRLRYCAGGCAAALGE